MKILGLIMVFVMIYGSQGKSFPQESSLNVPDSCVNLSWACSDLHIARKCKRVSSCMEIWESLKAPKDKNDICSICKEMVKEARDQLLSNETQEEIKEVFEGSCNLLPVKPIAKECRQIVDQLIPELIEMLASRMDPNMVCTVAGLCNNGKLGHLIQTQYTKAKPLTIPKSVSDFGKCKDCTQGMMFVRKALQIIPETDFTSLLLHSCIEEFQGTQAQCEDFMKELVPVVYNFMKVVNPEVFCSHMDICEIKERKVNKVGEDLTCEFCEAMVQYLKNIVMANTTKEELKTALENFCNDIKEFSDECKNLVNEYYDEFYDFLKNDLDPKSACKALGLCTAYHTKIPAMRLVPALSFKRPVTKTESLPVVTVLLSKSEMIALNRATPVKEVGERESVPAIRLLQSQKVPDGIEVEGSYNTKEAIHLRRVSEESHPQYMIIPAERVSNDINQLPLQRIWVPSQIASSDVDCSVCKAVVIFVEKDLKEERTEASIRKALNKVCEIFPSDLSTQCQDFVNQYTEFILALIIQEANPNEICAFIKACSAQDSILPPDALEAIAVQGIQCEVCKQVVSYLEKELENNRTEEAIKAALDRVCRFLPQQYSDKCEGFVNQYEKIIIDLLTKEVAPSMICTALGLCLGEETQKSIHPPPPPDVPCFICKQVISLVRSEIGENKTEEAIKAALDKVCKSLPLQYLTKCEQFMDHFEQIIVQLLPDQDDPTKICNILGFCLHLEEKTQHMLNGGGDLECTTCQYVIHFLQETLMQNSTEEEIKYVVEKVCDQLPETFAKNCDAFIDEYGASLIVLLAQKLDPGVLCGNICHQGKRMRVGEPKTAIKSLKLDQCTTCEMVVNYMDKMLENDDVDSEITKLVEKICTIIPASARDQCTQVLDLYGPYLLQMIGQLADSTAVCQAIDLCSKSLEKPRLLGGEKCTFGPSYWCQSGSYANACNAHEYCRQKVWKY